MTVIPFTKYILKTKTKSFESKTSEFSKTLRLNLSQTSQITKTSLLLKNSSSKIEKKTPMMEQLF